MIAVAIGVVLMIASTIGFVIIVLAVKREDKAASVPARPQSEFAALIRQFTGLSLRRNTRPSSATTPRRGGRT